MAPSYQREVDAARVAVEQARAHIVAIAPRTLDTHARRARRQTMDALREALYSPGVDRLYEAARQGLSHIDRLNGPHLDAEQRAHLADATTALHRAADLLRAPFWHRE
jgi:hypothetical protein